MLNYYYLSVNKRVKTEKERNTLKQLKIDIFNTKLDVMSIFKKHKFKIIDDMKNVKTTKNICYFNYRQTLLTNTFMLKLINQMT